MVIKTPPTTPRKPTDPDDNIPCKTPSPRSSASQAPPNPRAVDDEPTPRVNPHASVSSHPFKGLSRKFMPRKATSGGDDLDDRIHKRLKEGTERAKKLDLGPAQGVYDTVSVRERVRRWQAAGGGVVTGDDFLEIPPISPATPSPAAHRRGMSMSAVGELESRHSVMEQPLSPPPISKIFREGWDSASDGDRDAERRRARSKDRERKMKRRRDRERGLTRSSIATDIEIDPEARQLGKQVPSEDAEKGTDPGSTFTKQQHYPEDDGGIRVTPLKVKQRGSNRKKKKGKEKESPEDAGLGNGVEPEEVPKQSVLKEPIKFEDTKSEPGLRRRSREIDLQEMDGVHKVEVKAWDYDDGIRIYTKKSKTPIIAARFSEGGNRNSVRKGEKSVRARKEEFEAEMRRERKAQKDFEELIKQQEGEDQENASAVEREKDGEKKDGANNIEGSTVVGDQESAKKKWEDFDDGIRVRPLKTKGARRKRSPASSSTRKLGDEKNSTVEGSTVEATAEANPEVERQRQLEESIRRIRELEREDREDREKREQLEKEEYERREIEEKEKREKKEQENKEKDERKFLRQRELERKEMEREMERERQREKEREMARKREADRLKVEAEMERRKQRRREKERERAKERERERQRQEERRREKERIKKMESMERHSSPVSTRQTEPESGSETESMSTTESDPESEKELPPPTRPMLPLETNSAPTTPTRSKSKKVNRPMTPEDPLEFLGRCGTKRGTSPQRIKPERRWMWEKLASGGETTPLPYKATTPSPDPIKRRGSRKVKRDDSASPIGSPSPALVEEEQSSTEEEVRLPPQIPERPRRTKTKARRTASAAPVEGPVVETGESFSSAPATPMPSMDDLLPKSTEPKSGRSSAQNDGQEKVVETLTDTSLSEPPLFKRTELSVDPTPRKKRSDISTGTFGPKLASATSSFFKAVKAEFQAELQAAAKAAESTSSSEGEDLDVLNCSVDYSRPDESIQEQDEGGDEDPEIVTDLVTAEGLTPPPLIPAARAADTGTDTETGTETGSESSETESDTGSESGSQATQEQHPSADPIRDTEVSSEPRVQTGSQPEPEPEAEKKPLMTPSRKSSGKVSLEDAQMLLPKRSLRGSTSPPKPKRKASKARSQGTRTPTPSAHRDEARSYTANGSIRTPSDASLSTVKPLNIRPRDPSPECQTPPAQAPQGQDGGVCHTPDSPTKGASLKRKYTKHADLISILSVSKPGKSLRSATRTRSHGKTSRKVSTITIQDLMAELAAEEVKYLRELRTLVEDVIPVLFQTVLERADDVVRRRSLSGGKPDNYGLRTGFATNPTRPIVDMGISLERLKTVHERMPKQNPNELLTWAMDARKVYEEYLSVWRMGFQDVVVTLAPDYEDEKEFRDHQEEVMRRGLEMLYSFTQPTPSVVSYEGDPSSWSMPPPPEPIDEGEKVDVAFLLKRPLVRLKILAKLFKRMNILQPSASAQALASAFHGVVAVARRKIAEEKARIEDEAAASISVGNVSDIHSLLPRHDVSLDPTKRVRARDNFYMRLYHSSGRVLQRNVELILRDPAGKARPERTEILVCQFGGGEVPDKWLLFAPIPLGAISARTGDAADEIVLMVRGTDLNSQEELREILVLGSPTAAGFEWVQMLGLIPIPPEGPFTDKPYQMHTLETLTEEGTLSSRWQTPAPPHSSHGSKTPKALSQKSGQETQKKSEKSASVDFSFLESDRGTPKQESAPSTIEPPPEAAEPSLKNALQVEGTNEIKPAEQYEVLSPDFVVMLCIARGYKFLGGNFKVPETKTDAEQEPGVQDPLATPPLRHSASLHTLSDRYSAPSEGRSPSLQRSRKASKLSPSRRNSTISNDSDTLSLDSVEPSNYLVPAPTNTLSRTRSIHLDHEARSPAIPEKPVPRSPFEDVPNLSPDSKPAGSESLTPVKKGIRVDVPPPVPPHRVPTTSQSRDSNSPSQSPAIPSMPSSSSLSSGKSGFNGRRRTSSPLKHEYDPSSPSGSEPESEEEGEKGEINLQFKEKDNNDETVDESVSSGSEESSSEDEESDDAVSICSEEEDGDYPPPMLSIPRRVSKEPSGIISLPRQRPSSLTLASSAPTIQAPAPPAYKFRAWVFAWSTSQWEKLHLNECRILITSGHIEGFPSASPPPTPSSATPSEKLGTGKDTDKDTLSTDPVLPQKPSETSLESAPVFSLDLNPLTPVRRGTAVDVSIRTPLNSKFSGASLMLRCRSPAECETLYNAINNSRVYPLNYQAPSTLLSSLASSEMGISETSSNTAGGSVKRGWGSWGRSKTYRNGITESNPGSIISSGPSETSVGSLSSAFSRFRQHNRMFKSPLSSVASSSSSNAGDSRRGSPSALSMPAVDGNPVFKIRLYRRENASKWRDLGNSRLSILKPSYPSQKHPNSLSTGEEKRIVVTNKAGTLVFLDEVLGESSFERVARTGIAVSVLVGEGAENGTGIPGDVGGIGAKSIVYMMQMKGEAEAAYTFSIVGKLRY